MRIQNKKHGIYRVNGGKEYKASRLGGLERVHGGEKVIIRRRERKEKNRSVVREPTTTTTVRAMNKNQTLLEINAAIAAMLDSN